MSKSISPSCLGLLGLKLALPVSMWMRVRTSSSSERIFHAELLDALFVHEDADAGHVGQHLRQRELDVVVEGVFAQRGDLRLHLGEQVGQRTGVRPLLTGKKRRRRGS